MKKILTLGLLMTPFFLLSQQVAKNLTAANGTFIGFYEYKPTDYVASPSTSYPLIIFLHGIGERGDGTNNLPLVLAHGIPKNINQGHPMRFYWNGKWETFLVLSPQLSTGYGDWPNFYVEEMIKYAKNNLRIDTNRVFLTGLSLGGGGVWRFASQSTGNAGKLAGIAPVCGTCALNNACAMASSNLPVWAFHAQNDGVVGVGCTTSTIMAINNCSPAVKPLMTIYPDGGHGIWDRAYDTNYGWQNINMYEWFLGQDKSLPVNIAPSANAGSDFTTTTQPGSISLNGSASSDPDGNIARFIWKMKSGPSGTTIGSAVSTNGIASATGLTNTGNYVFELTVFDNRGGSSKDEVIVTVSSSPTPINAAPVAKAGTDQSITLPQNNVTLDASGSYDTDGGIVSWSWSKISGPAQYNITNPQSINTTVTGLALGSYSFVITVTDNAGSSGKDTVSVIVNVNSVQAPPPPPTNQPPFAKASTVAPIVLPNNAINLNGYASYDPDGTIQIWRWEKISGPAEGTINNPSAPFSSVSGLVAGTYQFQLAVTDNSGETSTTTISVSVSNPVTSQSPISKAGPDQSITLPNNVANLNGYGSYDPDGSIAVWLWEKTSGPMEGTLANPTAPFTSVSGLTSGIYQFRLTVTDNTGLSVSSSTTITVNGGTSSTPPTAKAGNDVSLTLPENSTALNGYGSYDTDGSIQAWEWTKASGPAAVTIQNPNSPYTSITGLVAGNYQFKLTVTDNTGLSASSTVNVSVNGSVSSLLPIVKAGNDLSVILPSNSTALNGYNSYDPDGIIQTWLWTKIGGPEGGWIANPTSGFTSITGLNEGVYSYKLTVVDNTGQEASDIVEVVVRASAGQANKIGAVSETNIANIEKITTYPNPAINLVNVSVTSTRTGRMKLNLLDINGRLLKSIEFTKNVNTQITQLDVSRYSKGVYVIEVIDDLKKRTVARFIKQ